MSVSMYRPATHRDELEQRDEQCPPAVIEPAQAGRFALGELRPLSELRLNREPSREPAQDSAGDDYDPLMEIDDDLYLPVPKSKPGPPEKPQDSREAYAAVKHGIGPEVSPVPAEADIESTTTGVAADATAGLLQRVAAELPDFREQEDPEQAVPKAVSRKTSTTDINRKYWGRRQQLERDRKAELKAHGETGYRPNVDVLTKALTIRLDDSGSMGIDKTLARAGVPKGKTCSVKTNASPHMKDALANVACHPSMIRIKADPVASQMVRSSEAVGTVLTNLQIAATVAERSAAQDARISALESWKADAEPRLQAVEAACARRPSAKQLALEMIRAGRSLQDIAEATAKSVPTVVRWKRDFKAAGELT